MITHQHTLARAVSIAGIGVHTGAPTSVRLCPLDKDRGIVFKRCDVDASNPLIPGSWRFVSDTRFATKLEGPDNVTLSTVEHLLAALAALSVDNVLVEVTGPEIPILDGSAAPFVALIQEAGLARQSAARRALRVLKEVKVHGPGGSWVSLAPASTLQMIASVDLPARHVQQTYGSALIYDHFPTDIAPARTFGFYEDAQKMWAAGLSQGASLDNTVVFQDGAPLNVEGLRFPNECARHKVLDALGDLLLIGHPLIARYESYNGGHYLNYELTKKLLGDEANYEITSLGAPQQPHSSLARAACAS